MKSFRRFLAESVGRLTIYRGESVHNKAGGPLGGKFFSTDRDWARQFTQTGRDSEIITRKIDAKLVLDRSDFYAGDDIEPVLQQAKKDGYAAVRFNEGSGEPDSVYVFNLRALR